MLLSMAKSGEVRLLRLFFLMTIRFAFFIGLAWVEAPCDLARPHVEPFVLFSIRLNFVSMSES